MAGAWLQDAGQHLQRRRLAGAVRADEGDALAPPDREGELAHHGDRRCRRRPQHGAEAAQAGAMILPGGESTTMLKFLDEESLAG